MHKGWLGNDSAVTNGAASLVQRVAEDGKEDDGRNYTLEGEEVLDLGVGDTQEWKLQ